MTTVEAMRLVRETLASNACAGRHSPGPYNCCKAREALAALDGLGANDSEPPCPFPTGPGGTQRTSDASEEPRRLGGADLHPENADTETPPKPTVSGASGRRDGGERPALCRPHRQAHNDGGDVSALGEKARREAHALLATFGLGLGCVTGDKPCGRLCDTVAALYIAAHHDGVRAERARCLAWCRRFRQFPPGPLPDIEAGIASGAEK